MPTKIDTTDGGSNFARRLALWSLVLLLGVSALLTSLIMYMPVRFAAQQIALPITADRLSGTIWNGTVVLQGNHVLNWQMDKSASWRSLAVVFNWSFAGNGSDIDGRMSLRPRSALVGPINGDVDWQTVTAFLPDVPIMCEIQGTIDGVTIEIASSGRTGAGQLRTTAGLCARINSSDAQTPAPATTVTLRPFPEGVEAVLTTQADSATPLVTARLTDGDRIVLTIHRAGAALVPGMPAGADSELDLPLATFLP